jgi:two-component system, NtrC family, response regulator GlrR
MGGSSRGPTAIRGTRADDDRDRPLIGASACYLRTLAEARRVALYDVPVLIQGETGTGKELFAHLIHRHSPRRDRRFVSINCASLPPELVESEFFGHRRGAFTHAIDDREGYVEEAHQGTLLLDEIVSLDLRLQAKLLRFLQEGEYRPIGAKGNRVSDARVVAASNVPLEEAVAAGSFRPDLFYRLSVYVLEVPPLRERQDDIPLLLDHFLELFSRRFGLQAPVLGAHALGELRSHPWPGNVRELENVVQRMVIRGAAQRLGSVAEFLPRHEGDEASAPGSFQEAKSLAIRQFEVGYLRRLLSAHAGNVSQAARASGKHRRALTELIRKHGLDPFEFRRRPLRPIRGE